MSQILDTKSDNHSKILGHLNSAIVYSTCMIMVFRMSFHSFQLSSAWMEGTLCSKCKTKQTILQTKEKLTIKFFLHYVVCNTGHKHCTRTRHYDFFARVLFVRFCSLNMRFLPSLLYSAKKNEVAF